MNIFRPSHVLVDDKAASGRVTIFNKSLRKTEFVLFEKVLALIHMGYANFKYFPFTNHIAVHVLTNKG